MSRSGLASEVRARLGPAPPPTPAPLVSIVVASHNGVEDLRTLLGGLSERTDYPHFELIVVDNGSSDESVAFLRGVRTPFPVAILANAHNESFSEACNQGAAIAGGELLLFLNNDVEPFEDGWLRELVACLRRGGAGAVGATLLLPHEECGQFPHGFAVQHRGLRFRDENGEIRAALHGFEADPLDERLGEDAESPAVVAAAVLVEAGAFRRVGGFSRGYLYGGEDIDLCLKLGAAGLPVLCSGRSLLIHRPGSTRRAVTRDEGRERMARNYRLLLERWGPLLRREHDLCALAGGGMWVQEGREGGAAAATEAEARAAGVCVLASDPPGDAGGCEQLERLREAALARGHRCLVLRGAEADDPRRLEYDVAIHLRGARRYVPAPGQLNVLWTPLPREDLSGAERDRYDLVLCGEDGEAALEAALAAWRPAELP